MEEPPVQSYVNRNRALYAEAINKLYLQSKKAQIQIRQEPQSQPILPKDRKLHFEEARAAIIAHHSQPIAENRSRNIESCNGIDKRKEIIDKIQKVIAKVENEETPRFVMRNQKLWTNCLYSERLILKPVEDAQKTIVSNSGRFNVMMTLLYKIHTMLQENITSTKRELYYQQIAFVKSQRNVDDAIRDICCLLESPPWELGILATSKGLIAGPLTLLTADGRLVDCMNVGGVLIPQDVVGIKEIKSTAKFVLVIEKDATFQKLLSEGALNKLGPCILITGKGYPDINTRLLLKRITDTLKLQALALVDADPHGIEIMFTYRFGSLAHSHLSIDLAVPSMRWLGIHPTDIETLDVPSLPLTPLDAAKLNAIKSRPYIIDGAVGAKLSTEIKVILEKSKKAEIEAVGTMSVAYLTDRYIPHKIIFGDLI